MKEKVIIIAGPTACGKTKFSIEAAKRFNGEIISADSMQIYKDMNIGTAKVTKDEMCGIPHHLLDIVAPDKEYSVADFQKDAKAAIKDILSRGKTPVIVGGTGLYIHSLICDVDFTKTRKNDSLREDLSKLPLEELYAMLIKKDPEAAKRIHLNDKKRIIRRLEILSDPENSKEFDFMRKNDEYDFINICLTMQRELLYERINMRVDLMADYGLVDEVKGILDKYGSLSTALQAIGYKEIISYLNGGITLEKAFEDIKQGSRRYAKRQLTWFRRENDFKWFDISSYMHYDDFLADAVKYIEERFS